MHPESSLQLSGCSAIWPFPNTKPQFGVRHAVVNMESSLERAFFEDEVGKNVWLSLKGGYFKDDGGQMMGLSLERADFKDECS